MHGTTVGYSEKNRRGLPAEAGAEKEKRKERTTQTLDEIIGPGLASLVSYSLYGVRVGIVATIEGAWELHWSHFSEPKTCSRSARNAVNPISAKLKLPVGGSS